jgi:uncharacterized membrane protein YccC
MSRGRRSPATWSCAGDPSETLRRAILRIIGTAVGAPVSGRAGNGGALDAVLGLAMALAGTISLYGAITARHAYAWLFMGLTFAMMLYDRVALPACRSARFAVMRMIETLAGTAACVA